MISIEIPQGMDKAYDNAKRMIENSENIKIYSHNDCDGISAGSILSIMLDRLNKDHEIEFISLDKLENLEIEHELTIFSDLGSGQEIYKSVNNSSKIIILDHHPPIRDLDYKNNVDYELNEINPLHYSIDGSHYISGGGLSYLLAKKFGCLDLSWIGVLAAVGDMQNSKTGKLEGLNEIILKDAVEQGYVKVVEGDLSLYGRQTRPLYVALSYFSDVELSITNDTTKAILLMKNLGIERKKDNGEDITLSDLKNEDKAKLFRKLREELLDKVPDKYAEHIKKLLIADSYELLHGKEKTFSRDVSEFSTAINACGRYGKENIALNTLKGDMESLSEMTILNDEKKYSAQQNAKFEESHEHTETSVNDKSNSSQSISISNEMIKFLLNIHSSILAQNIFKIKDLNEMEIILKENTTDLSQCIDNFSKEIIVIFLKEYTAHLAETIFKIENLGVMEVIEKYNAVSAQTIFEIENLSNELINRLICHENYLSKTISKIKDFNEMKDSLKKHSNELSECAYVFSKKRGMYLNKHDIELTPCMCKLSEKIEIILNNCPTVLSQNIFKIKDLGNEMNAILKKQNTVLFQHIFKIKDLGNEMNAILKKQKTTLSKCVDNFSEKINTILKKQNTDLSKTIFEIKNSCNEIKNTPELSQWIDNFLEEINIILADYKSLSQFISKIKNLDIEMEKNLKQKDVLFKTIFEIEDQCGIEETVKKYNIVLAQTIFKNENENEMKKSLKKHKIYLAQNISKIEGLNEMKKSLNGYNNELVDCVHNFSVKMEDIFLKEKTNRLAETIFIEGLDEMENIEKYNTILSKTTFEIENLDKEMKNRLFDYENYLNQTIFEIEDSDEMKTNLMEYNVDLVNCVHNFSDEMKDIFFNEDNEELADCIHNFSEKMEDILDKYTNILNQNTIIKKKNIQYFDGTGINANILGIIAGIILSKGDWRKPMLGFTRVSDENQDLKISLRCSRLLAYDGIHFGNIIRKIAESVGGSGGGHSVACGAYIPSNKKEEFFNRFNQSLDGLIVNS